MFNYHNMTQNELLDAAWLADDPLVDVLRLSLEQAIEENDTKELEEQIEALELEKANLETEIADLESDKEELLAALLEAANADSPDWDYINKVINERG